MVNKQQSAQEGFSLIYLLIFVVVILTAISFWFINSKQSKVPTEKVNLVAKNSSSPVPFKECENPEQLIMLFTGSGKKVDNETLSKPTTIRARVVNPNSQQLSPETPKILLNLFSDRCMIAIRDRSTLSLGGGFTWSGHVNENEAGTVLLSIVENTIYGYVDNYKEKENYEIRSNQDGNHLIIQIDKTKFPIDD